MRSSTNCGCRVKKTFAHPRADDEARRAFHARRATYEAAGRPLVWIDESGFARDMPRRSGYAPIGQRCYGRFDWHAKGRTNVIGALVGFHLIAIGLFECSVNADVFLAWVEHVLLPQLPKAAVIILDNATFHKRADIQNVLRQAGTPSTTCPRTRQTSTPLSTNGRKPKQSVNKPTALSRISFAPINYDHFYSVLLYQPWLCAPARRYRHR